MSVDYGVMPLSESDRIYYALQAIKEREYYSQGNGRKLMPTDLGKYTGEICGVLIPRFDNKRENVQSGLVKTENTRVNLRGIAKVIVDEKPLLLQSVPGAGKSFLIDEVAKLFGRYDGNVYLRPSLMVRYCSDYSYGSDRCKVVAWNICHYNTRFVYLAGRHFDNCRQRGQVDCH
jgi:midasin (ATPase involved in ribosome maturation)